MRISKVDRVNLLKDAIRLSRGPNSSLIREETDLGMKISKKDMVNLFKNTIRLVELKISPDSRENRSGYPNLEKGSGKSSQRHHLIIVELKFHQIREKTYLSTTNFF